MSKLKIKSGLIGILLLSGLFAGWQTLLIISVLILLFCEINEDIKKIIVCVISFFIGLTLLDLLWQIIVDGINLIIFIFNQFIDFLNYYLTIPISTINLNKYFIDPLQNVIKTLNEIVNYVFLIFKFVFVLCTLSKKNINIPVVSKYVSKVVNYINITDRNESNNNSQQQKNNNGQMFNSSLSQTNNSTQYSNGNQQIINNTNYQSNPTQFNNIN